MVFFQISDKIIFLMVHFKVVSYWTKSSSIEFTWTDPSHCQNQSSWCCLEFSGQWICLGLSVVNSPRMTEGLLPGFRHSVKLLRWPLFWMHSMPSCLSGCYQSLVPDGKPVHFPGLKIKLSSL